VVDFYACLLWSIGVAQPGEALLELQLATASLSVFIHEGVSARCQGIQQLLYVIASCTALGIERLCTLVNQLCKGREGSLIRATFKFRVLQGWNVCCHHFVVPLQRLLCCGAMPGPAPARGCL
jgi:hypothetical protein